MIVVYGYGTSFKRDGFIGKLPCTNCGHTVRHSLCRRSSQFTLFGIPIFSANRICGDMCESCGNIIPIDKSEYKQRKKELKENQNRPQNLIQ